MKKATFGPGGNGDWFYSEGKKSTLQSPGWLKEKGLDAFEYEAGNGIAGSEATLRAIGEKAREHGILMSLHTPYFISLSGTDPEKRLKSIEYIQKSLWAADLLGADTIADNDGMHSIGVATDIGYVTKGICKNLEGCEAVVLESNHDEDMLKNGPYPYDLKKRILSNRGHLSNKSSATFGAHLAAKGTKAFMLAHLSEENNTPDTALDEFISTIADPSISICVASPLQPTEMILNKEIAEYAFTQDNMCGNS